MKNKITKSISIKTKLLAFTIAVLVFSLALVTSISVYTVSQQLEKQMNNDGLQLVSTIANQLKSNDALTGTVEKQIDDKIKTAALLIGQMSSVDNEKLTALAKELEISEINHAGADRIIANSNLPGNLGWQYPEDHSCYPLFTKKIDELIEPARESSVDKKLYKYGAIALPSGGIVQVGILVDDLTKIMSQVDYQNIVDDLKQNDNIVYALVISKDLKAVAHTNHERIGIELTDEGSKAAAVDGKEYKSTYIYDGNGYEEKVYDVLIPFYNSKDEHIGALNVGLSMKEVVAAQSEIIRNSIIIALVCLTLCSIALLLLINFIINPLKKLTAVASKVSEGVLDVNVDVKSKDEIGTLSLNFNDMISSLRELVIKIKGVSSSVNEHSQELLSTSYQASEVSEQIANAAQEMAAGSQMQVKATEEASHSIKNIVDSVDDANTSVNALMENTDETNKLVYDGKEKLDSMIKQMNSIKSSVNSSSKAIKDLESISKEIGGIVEIINGIASQTNLLALNAAIEAARAGEAGKGFAVVAEEVRKLAEQSTSSAGEIKSLIEKTQESTKDAQESIEAGNKETDIGAQLINSVENSFNYILDSFKITKEKLNEVGNSINGVHSNTQEIIKRIEEVENVSEQSAANTEEIAASTEEQAASMEQISESVSQLTSLIEELQSSIDRFS